MMKTLRYITSSMALVIAVLFSFTLVACSDDDEQVADNGYGYVQFKLYKSASRAATQLDMLRQAHKVRVVMLYDGQSIEQTLPLNATSDADAEFGLRSDKLQLLAGEYSIIGFYLYDILDKELGQYSVDDSDRSFKIQGGGLTMHDLYCDVLPRGFARFQLTKALNKARSVYGAEYPFNRIKTASITVRNIESQVSYTFEKLPMSIKTDYKDGGYRNQYFQVDTIVSLPAGKYQIERYATYSDKWGRNLLEADNADMMEEPFVINDNKLTDNIACPIRLSMAAEYIKDYLALYEIWQALDGPNWSYVGEAQVPGCNWNFNKDMDMWGDQPGVDVDKDGRVIGLSLVGFGAKGILPDDIAQLSELDILYLGVHDETIGGNIQHMFKQGTARTDVSTLRQDYKTQMLARDPMQSFSECIQTAWDKDGKHEPIRRYKRGYLNDKHLYDTQGGTLTNQITGVSRAVMLCRKLTQFYLANSPITTENFWVDIPEWSPFYEEHINDTLDFKWNDVLTDVEIYNCPKLTAIPSLFITSAPNIVSANFAQLRGISADQILKDWNTLIDGPSGKKVQLLYLGYNNLEASPSHDQLKKMEMLGLLDVNHNKIKKFEPFGKGVGLVDAYLDFNEIEELVPADDGYFCNCSDVETFSVSHNKLTKVPNIFNTKNVYTIGDVDFSYNNISDFDTAHGAYKGINAKSVNLSNNAFERFPKELFETGSPIVSLNLAGNAIREIKNGEMTGEKSHFLQSLDLQMNKLSKLPDDFLPENIPYFYGLDISSNQFEHFPYVVLNCTSLTVLAIRQQRDDDGNRILKEWPTGLYKHTGLLAFYIGSNDLRKIDDTISPNIYVFEIKDNPNISITLPSSVCQYIAYGYYVLFYDPTQDIRGCDNYLDLEQ